MTGASIWAKNMILINKSSKYFLTNSLVILINFSKTSDILLSTCFFIQHQSKCIDGLSRGQVDRSYGLPEAEFWLA